ncbi:MFS general substrate transporter [Phanerochaete sordida]|uniref:MFS general substrate transporter n=1 Tax=Phanerochaete sordida TaxID=48140 RepID=A0A9P3LEY8_9APHY|nr:MFS general substrate transporter [Phanerochaete sordida]
MFNEKTSAVVAHDEQAVAAPATLPIAALSTLEDVSARRSHDFCMLPIPRRLRYDPSKPPELTLTLNLIFAAITAIYVSTLYYCQPILIQLAESYDVSDSRVSTIPTLMQSGYATGLLLIAPLGDIVPRRPLILLLSVATSALMLASAATTNFVAFEVLSVLAGVVSCVSQVLAPLTADLAPPARRGSALALLVAGVLLGIMCARVLAGVVARYTAWRVVYYVAGGLQGAAALLLYCVLPDYPVKNRGLTYASIMASMARYCVTEPQLVQAALVCMVSMACFTNFWVTLTFLLGGPPYYYSSLVIGLFGLVGILGILAAPLVGRAVDRLPPWTAALVATLGLLVFQAIQTGAGGVHIAAIVVVCFGIDVFRQVQQVALNTVVFGIEPAARSRMNAVLQLLVFIGQIMGTAVGTQAFLKYGWRPAAALSVAWSGFTFVVLLLRGPHCTRYTWFGYEGGTGLQRCDDGGDLVRDDESEVKTDLSHSDISALSDRISVMGGEIGLARSAPSIRH